MLPESFLSVFYGPGFASISWDTPPVWGADKVFLVVKCSLIVDLFTVFSHGAVTFTGINEDAFMGAESKVDQRPFSGSVH